MKMTREQWAKLTNEEKRIKVAKLCGKIVPREWMTNFDKFLGLSLRDVLDEDCVPDYLNDLNAMHEAEELVGPVLTKSGRWPEYLDNLRQVCRWDSYEERCNEITEHATAAQRAEAFVLTMDKE